MAGNNTIRNQFEIPETGDKFVLDSRLREEFKKDRKRSGIKTAEKKVEEFEEDIRKIIAKDPKKNPDEICYEYFKEELKHIHKKSVNKEKIEMIAQFYGDKLTEFSRAGSEITLALVGKYKDLNSVTDKEKKEGKEGDEIFMKKTKELWKNFAVHGFLKKDEQTGEPCIDNRTDLDGKASVELLKRAGFDEKSLSSKEQDKEGLLKFIEQGDWEEGYINIDTSNKNGIVVKVDEERRAKKETGKDKDYVIKRFRGASIDHHDPDSPWGTSATKFTYKMLVDMGLLEKTEQLDKMVDFVNKMDNGDYPKIEDYFKNSWKTLAGLQRFLDGPDLVKFFITDEKDDVTRELTNDELHRYGFIKEVEGKKINRVVEQEKIADKSLKKLKQKEKEGFIISSKRYGKIAINIKDGNNGNDVKGNFLAARAFGCDVYIVWNPLENGFAISSKKPIEEEFSQGRGMRETMWLRPPDPAAKPNIPLEEILKTMTDGDLHPEGKLKEYLDNPEAFLKEKKIENILGKETVDRIIVIMQEFKKDLLSELAKDDEWKTYKQATQDDILEKDFKKALSEALDIFIKQKNITKKINKEEFFEYVSKKML
ncbi:MAG TPA: hypothetical protein P5323_03215 [Candidatus Moranbacteria bacterium]|nr:hypothetical protein [Candidatus Moranbacteria bacterium]HRY28122.1 hypothetical protein [Candidatus Moranbacteria bacterium]HSA08287.1 hypothetical protein [Candidatus Moranbacteria bacterium]